MGEAKRRELLGVGNTHDNDAWKSEDRRMRAQAKRNKASTRGGPRGKVKETHELSLEDDIIAGIPT